MKELKNDGGCGCLQIDYNTVSQETHFTCPWTRARLKDNERSTCSIVSATGVDTRFQARGYTW